VNLGPDARSSTGGAIGSKTICMTHIMSWAPGNLIEAEVVLRHLKELG
jgi:hypothetical protein